MGLKDEIRRHRRTAYVLTSVEALLLITLLGQLFDNPFVVFMNPWNMNFVSMRNLMLVSATQMYLGAKAVLRNRRIPNLVLLLLFFTPQILFIHYLGHSKLPSSTGLSIPVHMCVAYNLVFSFSSALFSVYLHGVLWTAPTYTTVKGLFNYVEKSVGAVSRNTFYIYLVSVAMTMMFLGMLLIFKTLFSWAYLILPFRLVYETPWRMFNHLFLVNVSAVVYFFLMGVIDQLLVYNSSLIDSRLGEYCDDDLQTARFMFLQISELSIRYPQILRKTAMSHSTISGIRRYICDEKNEMLKTLNGIREQNKALESRIWLSVPQVVSHSDKPHVLVSQMKMQFVRKIRSYNFVEIYMARMMCFWRVRILVNRYRNALGFFLLVRNFVRYLKEHKDDYLLLEDVCSMFSVTMRSLHDEVVDVEGRIGLRLESSALSEVE